jgi:type IV pilus assembly protein PilW
MCHPNKLLRPQQGFTVVELLVAATIGLILLAGVIQIFVANRQTYTLQEASAYVQESGRFAMEFLSKDVRMAGFMGCPVQSTTNNLDPTKGNAASRLALGDSGSSVFDGANSFVGYRYDGTYPADLTTYGLTSDLVVDGTDIIVIKRANACAGGDIVCHNNSSNPGKTCPGVTGNVNSAEYKIADNTSCNIQQNDIVLITNCQTADIHAVTNNPSGTIHVTIAHGANLNSSPKLTNSYGPGSAIYKMSSTIYYIGFGTSGAPALFRCTISRMTDTCATAALREELVEGVYEMDVVYGVDTDGPDPVTNSLSPRRYVSAADVAATEWDNVAAARLTFRTRSTQDAVTRQAATYSYDGDNAVSDRRLRRDFSTTITLRNRVK